MMYSSTLKKAIATKRIPRAFFSFLQTNDLVLHNYFALRRIVPTFQPKPYLVIFSNHDLLPLKEEPGM